MDLYAAALSVADVKALVGGGSSWWPGPPSFHVRPLDAASTPTQERFSITERFAHLGSAEAVNVEYTVWASTSAATTQFSNVASAFGTSAPGPKEGDQVLYYGSAGTGAAPYDTSTIVRLGPIVTGIDWSRKDGFPTVTQLGKIAGKVASKLSVLLAGKVHGSPLTINDSTLLPPAGSDITLLEATRIPVEVAVGLVSTALPAQGLDDALHASGVNDFLFGDYVLDNDTHMEVRANLLQFQSNADATAWLDLFRGSYPLDPNGIAGYFDDATGQYYYLFTSGTQGAMLICRSTSDVEAASRSCEAPMARTAHSWKANLGG
jgi:hypothetical protein